MSLLACIINAPDSRGLQPRSDALERKRETLEKEIEKCKSKEEELNKRKY